MAAFRDGHAWLARIRLFWSVQVDALERHLDLQRDRTLNLVHLEPRRKPKIQKASQRKRRRPR